MKKTEQDKRKETKGTDKTDKERRNSQDYPMISSLAKSRKRVNPSGNRRTNNSENWKEGKVQRYFFLGGVLSRREN